MHILGIYSSKKKKALGTGDTTKGYVPKTFWFVIQFSENEYQLQALSPRHLPTLVRFTLPREQFLDEYDPEPKYYQEKTLPAFKEHLKDEFGVRIFEQTEEVIRENFDKFKKLGLAQNNSPEKTLDYVKKLLNVMFTRADVLEFEQATNINEQGISLRKSANLDNALKFYLKALELRPNDDHLMFNIARVYYDMLDRDKAVEFLEQALEINPDFKEASLFLSYTQSKM